MLLIVIIFCRYLFQLRFSSAISISSLRVKLNLATPDCISDAATVTLSILQTPQDDQYYPSSTGPSGKDEVFHSITLCGPVFVKPFIDVTELSLTLSLSHSHLLISPQPMLVLIFDNLFTSNYTTLTKEASDESIVKKADIDHQSNSRRIGALKYRMIRRQQQNVKHTSIIQTSLAVTVFPYKGVHSLSFCSKLFPLVFSQEIVVKLLMCASGYRVEEEERERVCESVRVIIDGCDGCDGGGGDALNALDILCWIASMSSCDNNK